MKLPAILMFAAFSLGACKAGTRQETPASPSPVNLATGDSAPGPRPGVSWSIILRRDGSSDSVVGSIVVGDSIKDHSRNGFLGRRDLSLRLFVKAGAEQGVFAPRSGVVIYPIGRDSLEIWVTADVYDFGFWLVGARRHQEWQGIICEDSFSHECQRRGTFVIRPT